MKTNSINSIGFKNLYIGASVLQYSSREGNNPKVKSEVKSLVRALQDNNIHKKNNVDIILCHNNKEGFFGVVSRKFHNIPTNPTNKHAISEEPNLLNSFKSWVDKWDKKFSSIN